MAENDINLNRVALFEVFRENDSFGANLIGEKIINFESDGDEYLHLNTALTRNIKKKVVSRESTDASKKQTTAAAIEVFDDLEMRGQPSKSIVVSINDPEQKKILDSVLVSREDNTFRTNCSELGNFFAKITKFPRGIIGFVQFRLKFTKNNSGKFLAVLVTDFDPTLCTIDVQTVLKYLEKSFKENFRTTMIYPYLLEERIPTLKKTSPPQSNLTTDENRIKIHTKTEDPAVYTIVGADEPRNPQKEVEKVYTEKSSEFTTLSEIGKFVEKEDLEKSEVSIVINDTTKLKVDLATFNEKYELFISKKGMGILIKDGNIEVYLGKKNLLNEQKIQFKSIEEIDKDDNSETKR